VLTFHECRSVTIVQLQYCTKFGKQPPSDSKVALTRNLKKSLPKTKKKKVVIIGDSHARGYAAVISSELGNDFEVTGTVIPGAQLINITNLADVELSALGKSDAVIVIGGANDINKNETNIGLTHLRKFVENKRNTNIMVVTAPHRYDLHESSCVNNEIVVLNRKLHKLVKTADNVNIIQVTLNRNDFTRHGMHLHISGKEKVAKLTGQSIKKLMSRKEEAPFILKWKDELKDPHLEKNCGQTNLRHHQGTQSQGNRTTRVI